MIRASTTPSIGTISRLIASAIARACARFLPERRMLIGDDLPSFIAERIMPPASKANSRSRNSGSLASPVRSCSTYSWAECSRSCLSWTLTTASIGPALGV